MTVRVPYVDLAGQHRPLRDELLAAVGRVLDSGQFVLGDAVAEFERRFADLCGTRHAVGVNSGTDALVLSLRALGVGPGDEVIVPTNSFVASAGAVALAGATPVLADVGADYNLDPDAVAAAVTPRTRAVMPVHLTGRPADMDAIQHIAEKHNLAVVEDAAQSVLASYRGKRVGALGTVGCFSLHPLKTLNACGDGGVVTTDDDAVADKVRVLRNLGLRSREDCVAWSAPSRLDTVQAAMLLVKLKYLERWTAGRRANAAFYREALAGRPGIELPAAEPSHMTAVYHTFIVQADDRDGLKRYLAERGIDTAVHYPVPIHLQTAAAGLGCGRGSFPVAERQAGRILSLPVFPELTREQLDAVADGVRAFAASR